MFGRSRTVRDDLLVTWQFINPVANFAGGDELSALNMARFVLRIAADIHHNRVATGQLFLQFG
jgi:hypothetical protein